MGNETPEKITYRARCEHDGCDWSRTTTGRDSAAVQNVSASSMVSHGLDTGHHETFHEEVEDAE